MHTNGARLGSLVLALLIGAALAPVLLVRIPAMVDYPNHLARMYLLSAAGSPAANPYYRVEWAIYRNLALDLVVPQLAQVFGVEAAMRVFLLGSQILVIGGATPYAIAGSIESDRSWHPNAAEYG
jgi:hypothetical protein